MDDQPNVPGAFLSGGWTEQKATIRPVELPDRDAVDYGSIYQAENGSVWKAATEYSSDGKVRRVWKPLRVVSPEKRRRDIRNAIIAMAVLVAAALTALLPLEITGYELGGFPFILVRFIVVIFALFACGKVVSHFRDQVVLPRE